MPGRVLYILPGLLLYGNKESSGTVSMHVTGSVSLRGHLRSNDCANNLGVIYQMLQKS